MILSRKYSFQAARKLTKINPDHICANLHGHTFQITIKIEGNLNPENDFVIDFYDLVVQPQKIYLCGYGII